MRSLKLCGAVALLAAVAVTAGVAHAKTTAKPAVKIAFSAATPQVEKIPTIQAANDLQAQGYPVSLTYLQSSEDPVQAVVRGDADFGSASASTVFQAIAKGAPVVAIMSANSPAYQIVAPASVTSPAGLDGMRVGIHAAVSSTTLYTKLMLAKYPNVKANILIVPGSANRIRALVAGQLDSSAIQLSDMPTLNQLAPGKFHVIYDVAKKYSFLMDAVIFVRKNFDTSSNRPLIKTVLSAILKEQKLAYENPTRLANAIAQLVPNTDAATAQQDANTYTTDKIWQTNGGFTKQDINWTLNAMQFGGFLSAPLPLSQCCDTSIVQSINAPTAVSATFNGKKSVLRPSTHFQPGNYAFTVNDTSTKDGFQLVGKGVKKATGKAYRGKTTWKVTLAVGTYTYGSVKNPKLRHRLVVAAK